MHDSCNTRARLTWKLQVGSPGGLWVLRATVMSPSFSDTLPDVFCPSLREYQVPTSVGMDGGRRGRQEGGRKGGGQGQGVHRIPYHCHGNTDTLSAGTNEHCKTVFISSWYQVCLQHKHFTNYCLVDLHEHRVVPQENTHKNTELAHKNTELTDNTTDWTPIVLNFMKLTDSYTSQCFNAVHCNG